MTQIQAFIFNPFQENTYVLYDETQECVIIDPGCYDDNEENALLSFIETNNLTPVKLLNTHCHVDHILGNRFVADQFGLRPEMHEADLPVLANAIERASSFGVSLANPPEPAVWLTENDTISFGNTELEILFTPGHSPGSITFYHRDQQFLISGDVLFAGSIGRTDLLGGSMQVLMESIINELLPLGDEVKVYSGHGPATTIGLEKQRNPFVLQYLRVG